ncbi:hypothetical protein EG68_01641 [Paragonimus skrjabini miyazakii]|uniref:Uncharacterized protein n=1 Tax=Paragonimus skrjabini miyazakii TaxID=59628 RepID=A0A8S9ZAS3_9TREM|nr:hypothetical protein EG68_01641 [Paragonimus skrjabini miyazakii]
MNKLFMLLILVPCILLVFSTEGTTATTEKVQRLGTVFRYGKRSLPAKMVLSYPVDYPPSDLYESEEW